MHALTNQANVQRQLASRKEQLSAVEADIKSGNYSAEDVAILNANAAAYRRMIAKYEAALACA